MHPSRDEERGTQSSYLARRQPKGALASSSPLDRPVQNRCHCQQGLLSTAQQRIADAWATNRRIPASILCRESGEHLPESTGL